MSTTHNEISRSTSISSKNDLAALFPIFPFFSALILASAEIVVVTQRMIKS